MNVPENSIAAFGAAIENGADGIEFDVRLSADGRAFVFHNFELDDMTSGTGPLVAQTAAQLKKLHLIPSDAGQVHRIPTLQEVLDLAAGRTKVEIEIKAFEPQIIAAILEELAPLRRHWADIEITSFEPSLLKAMSQECSIALDLLMPKSEPWMSSDYIAYAAIERARLSASRGVHLHVGQLSDYAVRRIRDAGLVLHVHGVETKDDLALAIDLEIERFDTNNLAQILLLLRTGTVHENKNSARLLRE